MQDLLSESQIVPPAFLEGWLPAIDACCQRRWRWRGRSRGGSRRAENEDLETRRRRRRRGTDTASPRRNWLAGEKVRVRVRGTETGADAAAGRERGAELDGRSLLA